MPNGHGGIPFLGSPVLFAAIAGWRLAYHLHRAPPTNTTAPMPILRPMPTCAPRSAASAMKLAGVIVVCIGLAAFAVVLWILRKAMWLQRAWDIGDFWVLGVLALFAVACAWWGGQLFRRAPASTPEPAAIAAPPAPEAATPPPRRVTVSHGFSATGVILLILSVLLPDEWHPVVLLLVGLACLVVSHALTPCEERMEKLRKARASTRQL